MENLPGKLFKKVISKFLPNSNSVLGDSDSVSFKVSNGQSSRPESSKYGPRFVMASSRDLVDEVFDSFRQRIYDFIDEKRELEKNGTLDFKVYREFGKVGGNRPYFYIRPFNHLGWLFERQGIGWVVSLADKVSAKDLFVRKGDLWDMVTILEGEENKDQIMVSSQRLSMEHIPLAVYVERLVTKIGLENSHRDY